MVLKLASWNVNGLRAVSAKPDWKWFSACGCDIIALQETKAETAQLTSELRNPAGFNTFFSSSVVKKGYSGTAVYSKPKPLKSQLELPDAEYKGEGRLIHLEYDKFHFINCYVPNGGEEIMDDFGRPTGHFMRVPFKMGFLDCFLKYAQGLARTKPVVVCGDFNIAHKEIDLARPNENTKQTGFLPEERAWLDKFISAGFVDTFRALHARDVGKYTWWSYKMRARERNIGWRIDYFFVSTALRAKIKEASIENAVEGSDHCPVILTLDI